MAVQKNAFSPDRQHSAMVSYCATYQRCYGMRVLDVVRVGA